MHIRIVLFPGLVHLQVLIIKFYSMQKSLKSGGVECLGMRLCMQTNMLEVHASCVRIEI